jgi:plastocyanin
MKMIKFLLPALTFLLCSVMFINSQATIWTVNVQNFSFSPDNLPNVKIGDTVRWIWVNGSHTTTSTTIPSGATTWDHPLNSGNQQFDYIPTVTGTYNYKCTPHAASGMIASFIVSPAVGIADNEIVPEITVSPNPFKDNVMIRFADNTGLKLKELRVVDNIGKIVFISEKPITEAVESMTINLSNLAKGVYFIKITDQADKNYTKKVMKE